MINIIICDDHLLIRNAVSNIVQSFPNCAVIAECTNGKQLLEILKYKPHPDLVFMDISMKDMNGYEATIALTKDYPNIKILVFSMFYSAQTVQLMLKYGAVGYLTKNSNVSEIKDAIDHIYQSGFHYNQYVTQQMLKDIKKHNSDNCLTKKEIELLPYLCSDATYKEIATSKNIAIKTIDRHKENICKKMNVKTRIGLTALAAKMGFIYS